MQKNDKLKPDCVVQLNPEVCKNKMFAGCFMTVTEPKSFGAQGYIQMTGENGEMGGQAYYRASFEEMDFIGFAQFVIK